MDDQADHLIAALRGEDDLGVVIRAHLHIESKLESLLRKLIPYYQHLEKARINYSQKVDLALAMGLKPEYSKVLRKLGKIRNDFAHKPGIDLTNRNVTDLYGALGQKDRDIVLEGYKNTNKVIPEFPNTPFNQLHYKERFILIVVTLYCLLETAIREAERRA